MVISMNKEISVKVILSAEDYCVIQKRHTQKLTIILSIIVPIILFVRLLKFIFPFSPFSFLIIGAMAALIFAIVFILPKSLKNIWIQQYNSNKTIQKEQRYVIKPDGFECFSDIQTSIYNWNDLYAFREVNEAFYIFTSQNQCFYILKKSFDNDEDIVFARDCLSNLPIYKKEKPFAGVKLSFIIYGCLFLIIFIALLILNLIG